MKSFLLLRLLKLVVRETIHARVRTILVATTTASASTTTFATLSHLLHPLEPTSDEVTRILNYYFKPNFRQTALIPARSASTPASWDSRSVCELNGASLSSLALRLFLFAFSVSRPVRVPKSPSETGDSVVGKVCSRRVRGERVFT